MTGSGQRRLAFNTRERLVSDDFNRAQQFAANDVNEIMRQMFGVIGSLEPAPGSVVSEPLTTQAPCFGFIVGGLLVQPQIGSTSLLVSSGLAMLIDPDSTPDPSDNAFKYCRSGGVDTVGQLVLTAGAVATRIDVIECRRVSAIVETSSRDEYDNATGTFSAALVPKVVRDELEFRVRVGTPGAGFPGTESGWLPLAVMSVPSTATSLDAVTLWDVRPLLSELAEAPFVSTRILPEANRSLLYADQYTAPGTELRVSGVVEGSLAGWRIGGMLASDNGSVDLNYLDVLNVKNQEPGWTAQANKPWFLYLSFPAGLPRWVKYSRADLAGKGRIPYGQRGIPILSVRNQVNMGGGPSLPLSLPTATGLGGTTAAAILVAAGVTNATPLLFGFTQDGRLTHHAAGAAISVLPSANTSTTETYQISDGVTHPGSARRIRVSFSARFTGASGDKFNLSRNVLVRDIGSSNVIAGVIGGSAAFVMPATGEFFDVFEIEVPIKPTYPLSLGSFVRELVVSYSQTGATKDSATCVASITGWHLGP